jgi:arginine decarboxylase-like protein
MLDDIEALVVVHREIGGVIATQYQPGVLELRHLAEAKKIGLGIIQSEMKFLQDDMKWMRERLERLTNGVNKLQTAFEHLLVLGEKGT